MPGGRPTKYKKEYCKLIQESGANGDTLEMFASSINVHVDSIREWAKVYPEFSESLKKAKQNAHVYFQKIGRAGAVGKLKGFNARTWEFWMKCRFNWSEFGDQDPDDNRLDILNLDENE